ncbi:MAG: glycosyltransferase family 2 protein [Selenomonas sp.]|nr:glycosyltransferase family 2 protein [Selenomonas sp.]
MPSISIIVPVYNAAEYLEECLDSICKQTLSDWEAICIDDGSVDGSDEILRKYRFEDSRFILARQEQKGAAAARNLGMSMAQGEYVMFLDSDDCYLDDSALEKLYAAVKEKNVPVAAGRIKRISYGRLTAVDMFPEINDLPPEGRLFSFEDYQEDYYFQAYIFARSLMEGGGIGFPAYRRYEDPSFLMQILPETDKILLLPIDFYGYRWGHHRQSPEHIGDVLEGILGNLKIAIRYGYCKLQRKLVSRLNDDFYQEITSAPLREVLPVLLRIEAWNVQGDGYIPIRAIPVMQQRLGGQIDSLSQGKKFIFPYHLFHRGESVAIYGAGNVGRKFYSQAMKLPYVRVAGLFDRNVDNLPKGLPVQPAGALKSATFDAVLIAVENDKIAEDIRQELMAMGIDEKRIFWEGGAYEMDEFFKQVLFPLFDLNLVEVF